MDSTDGLYAGAFTRNSATPFAVDMDGGVTASNALFNGNISSQATMSGGTIITSDSSTRVEIDGVANKLKFIQGGNEIVRLGQFDSTTGKSDEFGIRINDSEAKLFLSRTSTDFSSISALSFGAQQQFSTMEVSPGIEAKASITADTDMNKDGMASIIGIMETNAASFDDTGIFAGVVGSINNSNIPFRSAGVVGFNKDSVNTAVTATHFNKIPASSLK